jgi:hypothetical protein
MFTEGYIRPLVFVCTKILAVLKLLVTSTIYIYIYIDHNKLIFLKVLTVTVRINEMLPLLLRSTPKKKVHVPRYTKNKPF